MSQYRAYFVPGATDPTGKEFTFTPRQKAYARKHCKAKCLGLTVRAAFDFFGSLEQTLREEMMLDSVEETSLLQFDRDEIQAVYGVGIWWMNNNFHADGTLIPGEEVHSAIRHLSLIHI